jgi:integrase
MDSAKHYKKPSTITRNHYFLAHLKPYVSDKPLLKIDPMLAETYKEDRKNHGASNATVNRERSFLKAVLNKAVKLGVIDRNPLQYIEPLPESNFFNRYLSVSETLALIGACNQHLRPMIVTAIYTGLRWGSVKKLRWNEVDFENSVINLGRSKNGELIYPLPKRVKKEIVKISKNGSPYIFVNPKTKRPWENIRSSFEKAKKKADINRPFRLHDLGHSFASNLVMGGYDLKTVQELLGHRNITTTSRYAHLSMLHKKKAVDGLFQKKRGANHGRPS